jgi:ABC-type dipeptide/oligopeptide/nickel transport system permease subunit
VRAISGFFTIDGLPAGRLDVTLDALRHLALPAVTLALAATGASTRLIRASLLEVLSADYIRRARAAGLSEWVVLTRYALPNALIPFVTTLGLLLAGLLGGAVVTEIIFGWPGLGNCYRRSGLPGDHGIYAVLRRHLRRGEPGGGHRVRPAGPARESRRVTAAASWSIHPGAKTYASMVGAGLVGLVLLLSLVGPFITPYAPDAIDLPQRLTPPGAAHWLGTDELGRDLFSRIANGGRYSLLAALSVVSAVFALGSIIGGLSAIGPRWADTVVMRLCDILLSVPALVLAMALAAALGPGLQNAMIALVVARIPAFGRADGRRAGPPARPPHLSQHHPSDAGAEPG